MKLNTSKKLQAGFMNALIMFGIALIVAMMAAWAIANRSSNTNASTEQTKMNASVILKQASDLKDGFARAQSDGYYPENISFNATAPLGLNTSLFAAGKGYATMQSPPIKSGASGALPATFIWNYSTKATVTNVGTASADYIVSIGDLNVDVCDRINNMLYNMAPGSAVSTTNNLVDFATPATALTLTDEVLAGVGKTDSCIKTADSKYVYYKVMVEN